MPVLMSACGVLCSGCAAYRGNARGREHQERTVAAWKRIYRLNEKPERIACLGCAAPDDQVFHTSLRCKARRCCRSKGFQTCAECDAAEGCAALDKAQAVWDGVPKLAARLSKADFAAYAQPYCGHRERLAAARRSGC
jgi:hypothetical protein